MDLRLILLQNQFCQPSSWLNWGKMGRDVELHLGNGKWWNWVIYMMTIGYVGQMSMDPGSGVWCSSMKFLWSCRSPLQLLCMTSSTSSGSMQYHMTTNWWLIMITAIAIHNLNEFGIWDGAGVGGGRWRHWREVVWIQWASACQHEEIA